MSPFSQLLRRGFASASSSAFSQLSYRENDIAKLVESFKTNSISSDFRRKSSYYERTVKRLANLQEFQSIEEILEHQKKFADITNESFAVRLISLYGVSGLFDRARQMFDEMPELKCERTIKSFNALLEAGVNSKSFDKVDVIFRELPEKLGFKRDVVSYNAVIKGLCKMGSVDLAALMLDEMEKEGVNPNVVTFNILLHALFRNRRFVDGEKMLDMMGKYNVIPNIITYNRKLLGLVSKEKTQEVIDFVVEIRNKGLKPDLFTFNILFKSLCRDGKHLDEAKRWYNVMIKQTKCKPDVVTCATLLPFACDNGDFQFAAKLCRTLFYGRFWLKDVSLVQRVIDGLVQQSNVKEAAVLVRLGRESKHSCYHSLQMPS